MWAYIVALVAVQIAACTATTPTTTHGHLHDDPNAWQEYYDAFSCENEQSLIAYITFYNSNAGNDTAHYFNETGRVNSSGWNSIQLVYGDNYKYYDITALKWDNFNNFYHITANITLSNIETPEGGYFGLFKTGYGVFAMEPYPTSSLLDYYIHNLTELCQTPPTTTTTTTTTSTTSTTTTTTQPNLPHLHTNLTAWQDFYDAFQCENEQSLIAFIEFLDNSTAGNDTALHFNKTGIINSSGWNGIDYLAGEFKTEDITELKWDSYYLDYKITANITLSNIASPDSGFFTLTRNFFVSPRPLTYNADYYIHNLTEICKTPPTPPTIQIIQTLPEIPLPFLNKIQDASCHDDKPFRIGPPDYGIYEFSKFTDPNQRKNCGYIKQRFDGFGTTHHVRGLINTHMLAFAGRHMPPAFLTIRIDGEPDTCRTFKTSTIDHKDITKLRVAILYQREGKTITHATPLASEFDNYSVSLQDYVGSYDDIPGFSDTLSPHVKAFALPDDWCNVNTSIPLPTRPPEITIETDIATIDASPQYLRNLYTNICNENGEITVAKYFYDESVCEICKDEPNKLDPRCWDTDTGPIIGGRFVEHLPNFLCSGNTNKFVKLTLSGVFDDPSEFPTVKLYSDFACEFNAELVNHIEFIDKNAEIPNTTNCSYHGRSERYVNLHADMFHPWCPRPSLEVILPRNDSMIEGGFVGTIVLSTLGTLLLVAGVPLSMMYME
jgi:hypothetical protein